MPKVRHSLFLLLVLLLAISPALAQEDTVLTVYSGRSESLIAPILEQFTEATGIEVEVLYGSTAAVANQIIEEGDNSPADVYIGQDAGALGALAKAERLATLPPEITGKVVNPAFVSPADLWVGISGRARVLVYNPEMLAELGLELPESLLDLTDESWRGLVGWAPTNGSFQANVTAMRVLLGDEATLAWLEGMVANAPQTYEGNTPIVQAVINGEIPVGLVNHYYIYRFLAEDPDITTSLHYFPGGDPGALVNVAGAGIVNTTDQPDTALALIDFLLSEEAQTYFATETFEYPLVEGVDPGVDLVSLEDIEVPELDLSDLDDLQGTLEMIEDSGALDG
jgi:iron(III) transport system substrate-binding protein